MISRLQRLPALPLCAGVVAAVLLINADGAAAYLGIAVCCCAIFLWVRCDAPRACFYAVSGIIAGAFSSIGNAPVSAPDDVFDGRIHSACARITDIDYGSTAINMIADIESIDGTRCPKFVCRITIPDISADLMPDDDVRFNARFTPCRRYSEIPALDADGLNELSLCLGATAFVVDSKVKLIARNGNSLRTAAFLLRDKISAAVYASRLSPETASLLVGSWLGTGDAMPHTKQRFRAAGLSHLLCVSGFHVALAAWLMSIILWPLRAWTRAGRIRYILLILAVWVYAALTGMHPSAVRAAIMITCFYLCRMSQISIMPGNSLLLAVAIILIYKPYWLFAAGFQLSVGAVTGLILFAKAFNRTDAKAKWLHRAVDVFCIPAAAMLATFPLLLFWFGRIPVAALPFAAIATMLFPLFMLYGAATVILRVYILSDTADAFCRFINTICLPAEQITATQIHINAVAAVLLSISVLLTALAIHYRRRRIPHTLMAAIIFAGAFLLPGDADAEIVADADNGGTAICIRPNRNTIFAITGGKPSNSLIYKYTRAVTGEYIKPEKLENCGIVHCGPYIVAAASHAPDSLRKVDILFLDTEYTGTPDSIINRLNPELILIPPHHPHARTIGAQCGTTPAHIIATPLRLKLPPESTR